MAKEIKHRSNGEILRISPVFREKPWGGKRLNTVFGYTIPSEYTGECWAISGHPDGDCPVADAGRTLGQIWKEQPELFGNLPGDIFPLIIKIIDARENLSIQVHPDDEYAGIHEKGSPGKTECWYVLDCERDAEVIIGHNASSREEMKRMVEEGNWSELLREIPIRKGDFFQINPGCLHAIKAGTLILETQQSSDVTYRFYDYGRQVDGIPRELHIPQALAVTAAPFAAEKTQQKIWQQEGARISHLVTCRYYSVYRVELQGETKLNFEYPFVCVSILSGCGTFNGMPVKRGDHLVLTANFGELCVSGALEFIYSHV
ncbi:MAG: mannose-6-phosphate isomerase, class I [Lachnospiraceae bacterium]|nr:mannose-6-phosphate isomerase, class I [Lachnospiraceae bacterium]